MHLTPMSEPEIKINNASVVVSHSKVVIQVDGSIVVITDQSAARLIFDSMNAMLMAKLNNATGTEQVGRSITEKDWLNASEWAPLRR